MLALAVGALLPPLILMVMIYREDKVEKEPFGLIAKAFLLGVIAVIPILIVEMILDFAFKLVLPTNTIFYLIIDNFIGVALIEEYFKYRAVKRAVWENQEFDYTFDGIVYAVAASLGFAAVENIQYVAFYGMGVAVSRAITSIPGHTIFGIFMGIYLGMAKYERYHGTEKSMKRAMRKALIIPMLIHGMYDFMLSMKNPVFTLVFFVLLIVMDIVTIRKVRKKSKSDQRIFDL